MGKSTANPKLPNHHFPDLEIIKKGFKKTQKNPKSALTDLQYLLTLSWVLQELGAFDSLLLRLGKHTQGEAAPGCNSTWTNAGS